jgi:hypothetical protein
VDNHDAVCNTPNVPRPKRRKHGAAGVGEGQTASKRLRVSSCADCSAQIRTLPGEKGAPAGHTPDRLPDPWLIDSAHLLAELARIRALALTVPLTVESYGPSNSVVDAIWRLEEQLGSCCGCTLKGKRPLRANMSHLLHFLSLGWGGLWGARSDMAGARAAGARPSRYA